MNKLLLCLVFGLLFIVAHAKINSTGYAYEYVAKVVYIVDGDTVYVQDKDGVQHKIRIANIDAPEKNQSYGNYSRENLLFLTNKNVVIKTRYHDHYGREVSDIYHQDNDIGLQQIKDGCAWMYPSYAKKYLPKNRLKTYYQAQKEAQITKTGLWKEKSAIPPWEFRRNFSSNELQIE